MSRPFALRRCATAVLVVALASTGGCVSDAAPEDEDADEVVEGPPIESVTVPPERLTPFCQAMIDLSDELETDPPDDSAGLIVETYERVLDEVPDEIAVEFEAVLDALRVGARATTPTDPVASATTPTTVATATSGTVGGARPVDEGYLPDEDPAARVNAYVEFACRGVANNPGPPPTAPPGGPVGDTVAEG